MNTNLRKWLPIAVCCLPGMAVAAIIGIGIAFGGAAIGTGMGGPLGLGLLVLATLACPVSMGLMMLRQRGSRPASTSGRSAPTDCCLPGSDEETPADRLAALRAQREALERKLAALQAQ
jgi:hypothetical protein